MPDKTEKSAAPKVIKWTEEEWASVANHLFGQKGAVLLSSPRLEEIRAKDVFLAQETLPEDRHRKLISIAQGFQGIRDRLSTIFQGMSQASQNDLFNRAQPQQEQPVAATEAAAVEPAQAHDLQPGQEQKRPIRERKPRGQDAAVSQAEQPKQAPQVKPDTALPVAAPVAPAVAPQQAEVVAAQDKPASVQNVQNMQNVQGVQAEQPQRRPEQNNGMQGGRDRHKERGNEGRPQPQFQQAANAQATAGFLEAARPFVAMVCEEMAIALVKAFAAKGGEQQFGNMLQKALAQFAPNQANGQSPRPERQNQQRHERAVQPQMQPQPQPQPQAFSAAVDMPERAFGADVADEDGGHPAEVQPLFDPKLPPSANSDFKPTIGLVGSNIRELDDLQLLYPQLRLTVVAPEAVRSADVFRQCQRIIGLREDVAQPVDELLRRLLRNRYIRIAGGIPRVREQLNSWLHNPNSINAEPRPHVPRGPKGPGQGQGQGDGGKKRHNRHLRSPR